jgi:hypothetical protein
MLSPPAISSSTRQWPLPRRKPKTSKSSATTSIEKIREDKLDGIRYKGINFTPGYRESLRAGDWDAYWAWARKDKLGVYVQRRPAVTAVREQLDAGKTVPGIEIEKISVLYVSKAAQRK